MKRPWIPWIGLQVHAVFGALAVMCGIAGHLSWWVALPFAAWQFALFVFSACGALSSAFYEAGKR